MCFRLTRTLLLWMIATLLLAGCSEEDSDISAVDSADSADGTSGGEVTTPTQYVFESKLAPGQSSVSYSGQVFRHVLIEEMKRYVGGLNAAIDQSSALADEEGEVVAALDFYYRFDSAAYGDEPLQLSTEPATKQRTFNDISVDKDLRSKVAGQDPSTDHVSWSESFVGWSDASLAAHGGAITSPDGFITAIFETIEANAIAHANGVSRRGPGGEVLPIFVTDRGVDLQQLLQKFLTMSVTFHQGTDDYLDSDIEGKGLRSDNTQNERGEAYTTLEHAWDEGFGYFGAAFNYGDYTDEELAAKGGRPAYASGYHDANGDGAIDLLSEYTFGLAANAAKRDLDSQAATDLSGEAFRAFVKGRAIIAQAAGRALSADEMTDLEAQRDIIVLAWERAAAATVVHYINDSIRGIDRFGAADHDLLSYIKGWSELKGFALGLQFNPRSPLTDADFMAFHQRIGDAPALPSADVVEVAAYRQALLDARAILQRVYAFDLANMGDDNGENGW
jgi:hypothetical protein